ncbi:hypothetical protein BAJT_16055 [Bacillus velezensis]|nr:hypothetical protein BSO20_15345 [Bacillus amyloliquefaciens]ARB34704.1 hypothetical protein BAJT_16055 [Bacillus velezensis]ARM29252.1 hypothetical protein B9C48_16060 [Bacillus vallismortis]AVV95377.1 hypothetical protein DA376_16285 [Bacillus velezensis]AWE14780.1 hypothetical protein DDE72_00560 [Bacillus velezensis]
MFIFICGVSRPLIWRNQHFIYIVQTEIPKSFYDSMKPFSFIDETKKRAHFKAPAPELILR